MLESIRERTAPLERSRIGAIDSFNNGFTHGIGHICGEQLEESFCIAKVLALWGRQPGAPAGRPQHAAGGSHLVSTCGPLSGGVISSRRTTRRSGHSGTPCCVANRAGERRSVWGGRFVERVVSEVGDVPTTPDQLAGAPDTVLQGRWGREARPDTPSGPLDRSCGLTRLLLPRAGIDRRRRTAMDDRAPDLPILVQGNDAAWLASLCLDRDLRLIGPSQQRSDAFTVVEVETLRHLDLWIVGRSALSAAALGHFEDVGLKLARLSHS